MLGVLGLVDAAIEETASLSPITFTGRAQGTWAQVLARGCTDSGPHPSSPHGDPGTNCAQESCGGGIVELCRGQVEVVADGGEQRGRGKGGEECEEVGQPRNLEGDRHRQ